MFFVCLYDDEFVVVVVDSRKLPLKFVENQVGSR